MDIHDETGADAARDEADLARFGYKQELRRSLGVFSSFAVAFSYISPSTGIFTLFALGLTTIGGVFIWTWPVVALGQFIIALNFAEVTSHFPLAGSVFQWSNYMANRAYSWFTGWIYLFAGILAATSFVAPPPLARVPALALIRRVVRARQRLSVLTTSRGPPVGALRFLIAVFVALSVSCGFDPASTVGGETRGAGRPAPKAVPFAVIGAFITGGVFL